MYTIVKSNRITSFDNKFTIRPVVVSSEFVFSRNAYKQNKIINTIYTMRIYSIYIHIVFKIIIFENW